MESGSQRLTSCGSSSSNIAAILNRNEYPIVQNHSFPNILNVNDSIASDGLRESDIVQIDGYKTKLNKKSGTFSSKLMDIDELNSKSSSSSINSQNQRKKFTAEEDMKLRKIIAKYGARKWDQIAVLMPGRTGRQCRDRFHNYLSPSLQNGPWSKEEDLLLEQKVYEIGQHWNKIVKFFQGRSENNIKNRWYTYVSKHKQGKCSLFQRQNIHKNSCVYEYNIGKDNICNNYSNNFIIDQFNNNYYYYNQNNIYSNFALNSNVLLNQNNYANMPVNNNLDNISNNQNFVQEPKPEKNKKVFFPPIFPPNDNMIWPLNQGMFDFLNREFVA